MTNIPNIDDYSIVRAGPEVFEDHEGVWREVPANVVARIGHRYVQHNLASGLVTESITVVVGRQYQILIDGTNGASAVISDAAIATLTCDGVQPISLPNGNSIEATTTTLTITVTGTLTELLVQDVTYQSNSNPDDPNVLGVCVDYENGSTVDATGKVTLQQGNTLLGTFKGIQYYGPAWKNESEYPMEIENSSHVKASAIVVEDNFKVVNGLPFTKIDRISGTVSHSVRNNLEIATEAKHVESLFFALAGSSSDNDSNIRLGLRDLDASIWLDAEVVILSGPGQNVVTTSPIPKINNLSTTVPTLILVRSTENVIIGNRICPILYGNNLSAEDSTFFLSCWNWGFGTGIRNSFHTGGTINMPSSLLTRTVPSAVNNIKGKIKGKILLSENQQEAEFLTIGSSTNRAKIGINTSGNVAVEKKSNNVDIINEITNNDVAFIVNDDISINFNFNTDKVTASLDLNNKVNRVIAPYDTETADWAAGLTVLTLGSEQDGSNAGCYIFSEIVYTLFDSTIVTGIGNSLEQIKEKVATFGVVGNILETR